MPRAARVYTINYPHQITQRANNGADVFSDNEDRRFYLKSQISIAIVVAFSECGDIAKSAFLFINNVKLDA